MKFLHFLKSNQFIFFILFAIFQKGNLFGQNREMSFRRYSKEQGLSNIFINSILQDKQGFIWIGTWYGLNRFDGYQFKVFKPLDDNPATLTNSIKLFAEDKNDRIWILSPKGLINFDKKKNKFNPIYTSDSITYEYFSSLIVDSKGTLWMGTESKGLWALSINNTDDYSKTKPDFKRYVHDNTNPNSLSTNRITGIFEDKQSNIWISTGNKIIDRFNAQTGNFEHYPINIGSIENQTNWSALRLEDSDGLYWITTFGAGLISWDLKHNIFKQYLNIPGKNSLSSNIINHIRQASDGILWISTDGGGISLLNKKTGQFETCKNELSNPNSISGNNITLTIEDRSGVTWIGTSNMGLNKYELEKEKLGLHVPNPSDVNGLNHKLISSIIEDKDQKFWIGTDGGGLNFWDKKTEKFRHFVNDPFNSNSISGNAVVCLTKDFNDNIWVGTFSKGLNCYLRKEGKFIHFIHDPNDKYSISHNNIWALLVDSKHNLWVGTLEGTLNLYDRKTNRFHSYKKIPNDPNSFIGVYTTNLFEDSRHYLWISTSLGLEMVKLNEFDFNKPFPKLKFNHYRHKKDSNGLSTNNIFCVFEDHTGNMWFGTFDRGLIRLDIKTNVFTSFTDKDGLPSLSIKAILEDNDYNLWISTENGISRFNPNSKTFHNYSFTDGLQGDYFSAANCKTSDDKLIFGGTGGFNVINPGSLTFKNVPPKTVLTDFKVNNTTVTVDEEVEGDVLLKKSITRSDTLILSPKIKFFSFEFSTFDYTNPEKTSYAYKMDGFENQWHHVDAKDRTATYTNLSPGEYLFRVKASNNYGIWNNEDTSIRIIILPPWWITWWFKMIWVLLISLTLAYIAHLIYNRLKQQANQTILNERDQLKTVINNIPHFVFIKDINSRFIVINQGTIKFMGGKDEKEFINKTDYDFYPIEEADQLFEEEQKIMKTGISKINSEKIINLKGKEIAHLTTKCPIINQKNETIGLVGITIDITEQKMAQREIEKQNQEINNYNNILSEANVLLEERQQQIEEQSEELQVNNENLKNHQLRIEEQANELRVYSENLKDINNLLVEKQNIVMSQAEQMLEANKELSLLNATKDRFFFIIAHDLRNPFNSLIGFSELLLKNYEKMSSEKIKNYLQIMHTSSTSGHNLLENLLQWSRTQTGHVFFEPVCINLSGVINETFKLLAAEVKNKKIILESSVEPDVNLLVDENMVKTIIRNLITNAIKFTPNNGQIKISAIEKDSMVEVTVADTGIGIPAENMDKLFRIDTIVSTPGTNREKGTGLGLLLCMEFVKKHGGIIWVKSSVGKGSEFKFTLPLG